MKQNESYRELSIRYTELNRMIMLYSHKERDNGEYLSLINETKSVNEKLKALDAAVQRLTNPHGNYASR